MEPFSETSVVFLSLLDSQASGTDRLPFLRIWPSPIVVADRDCSGPCRNGQMDDPTTIEEAAIEDRSSDDLRRAQARLTAATTGPELEALAELGARQQRRWGSFARTTLRRLGEWLNRTPLDI